MSEIAPLAARAFARPATTVLGSWWAKRQGRRLVALRLPSVKPHRDCKDDPHASLRESVVTNFSTEPVFDVQLHLPGATGDEMATVTKPALMPGEAWKFGWSEHRGRGAVPLLRPDEGDRYNVAMDLLWADRPGGPLWRRGAGGKVKRAPGHQLWRRALNSVRRRLQRGTS
ncbi:hypothetical protein [Streptomyces anulatus]|uniref:hypothetical protein n=1 Tax=Streptomyces anulatus TaxID=1892 RepID=UPI003868A1C4|nr:hypothetical protein OG882_05050 [Streptomyces anulatus]